MNFPIWFVLGCVDEPNVVEENTDQFVIDDSVRIESPENGALVEDSFFLRYTVGNTVAGLELRIDDVDVTTLDIANTETLVALDGGAHKLELVAFDVDSEWLSQHSITVTVPTEYWVTIASPSDGSVVTNPVGFTVNASDNIEYIELFADEWSLGRVQPDQVLNYNFSGTGFAREVEAIGFIDEEEVATHSISITVDEGSAPIESDFNEYVNSIIPSYPTDGSYGYYWPSSGGWLGTTEDILYQGTIIAEGDTQDRSYCVGLTFEVFMKAWLEIDYVYNGDGSINGMIVNDLIEFRKDWYVRDLFGSGPAEAVDNYGIGELVTDWDDVESGDFIQFWRNSGSGHNAIFIDWEWDLDDNRIGFLYWSTQNSTDGIGYNSEYFGSTGSSVNAQYFYPARIYTPDYWLPW